MYDNDTPSPAMPDNFDRQLGALDGLPDVSNTKAATVRTLTPILGSAETFIVQTFRQRERGDTIFVELLDRNGSTRLVLPPKVADLIARQRDALTAKSRSKAAKQAAADRKERGEVPFIKKVKA